jgi:CelD/BcsL family acetyltransferase involved in cellulose biosynthesis
MRPVTGTRAPLSIAFVDRFDPLHEDWTRLAVAGGNVFGTWEWNELWWRHYGRDRALRIAVLREEEEIAAIVPLFRWSQRPLRILRLVGHGHGDCLGPVCEDDSETAEEALRLALEADPHDVFIGDWVAGERDWGRVLRGRVVRRTGYPILRLPASWDEFLSAQSTRFRKSARNQRNRLYRSHDVAYRYADAVTLERDLDDAFRLHRARFGAHAQCNYCGEHERFQRAFAARALERGWLRLLFLEVDGEPVCFEHGFSYESAHFAYQAGRDPAWDRHSVGFVLDLEAIRRAVEAGVEEFRFLGGEEDYKYRYRTEDPRLETVAAPGTGRGGVAVAALAAMWRFPIGEALVRRIGSARPD